LEDILSLTIRDMCERRLQTIVVKKGLARTVKQARQFITHEHILVGERKITAPSYIVNSSEETTIRFAENSPLAVEDHPESGFTKNVKEIKEEKSKIIRQKESDDVVEKVEPKKEIEPKDSAKETKVEKVEEEAKEKPEDLVKEPKEKPIEVKEEVKKTEKIEDIKDSKDIKSQEKKDESQEPKKQEPKDVKVKEKKAGKPKKVDNEAKK
jgi:ribosomal protein S4